MGVKVRDVLKRLREDGWRLDRCAGDHRQFVHDSKPGLVTVAGHPSDEVKPKTLASIFRQAGWSGRP
jgi:predicted RNA binding protein YcfA (HicA-like mRNA interferase family)